MTSGMNIIRIRKRVYNYFNIGNLLELVYDFES